MQKKYFMLIAVLVVGFAIDLGLMVTHRSKQIITQNLPSPVTAPPILLTPSSTQPVATSTPMLKIYRNEQFGLEFQYPEHWIILENSFGSYYSKFNIIAAPNIPESNRNPFLVNVVLPEFADKTFLSSDATTSTVVVGGVSGIKYQYEFEGSPETAIVLPLGQYKIILGTTVSYQDDFNRIVSTFKFLK